MLVWAEGTRPPEWGSGPTDEHKRSPQSSYPVVEGAAWGALLGEVACGFALPVLLGPGLVVIATLQAVSRLGLR